MSDGPGRETYHLFDLIFKRLVQESSPQTIVSLVNGLFDTTFPLDSPVSFPNKEHVAENLRQIVSDMMILIAGEIFHLEAQIDNDLNMALRMFRYGYYEAISRPQTEEDGSLTISFPQARILYWETTKRTPENITLHIVYPDRSRHDFIVPAFKVLEHGIEELEKKKLALLLPFYVLKYRKQVKAARSEEERRALVPEVEKTMGRLLDALRELRGQELLTDRDEELMLGEIEVLYRELYKPYEGFREAKTMVDERILTRFDKVRMEADAKVAATEAKMAAVAQNLLKAGVSRDIILQATGLTITDVENQAKTASAPR
jgi:predicted transposase/invertase (TIGR01784 family)